MGNKTDMYPSIPNVKQKRVGTQIYLIFVILLFSAKIGGFSVLL